MEDPKLYIRRVEAARLGCGQCGAAVRVPPAGDPFSQGPYRGRYWCADCWTVYYDSHQEHFADPESRAFNHEEALRIREKRASEVLYKEGENRVYLTERGTIMFELKSSVPLSENEYDPERFIGLMKALQAIREKVPGYEVAIPISA